MIGVKTDRGTRGFSNEEYQVISYFLQCNFDMYTSNVYVLLCILLIFRKIDFRICVIVLLYVFSGKENIENE